MELTTPKTLLREIELEQIPLLDVDATEEYIVENYRESLNEMARINVGEVNSLFPYNKFNITIYSNDHIPPHFHVIADGWDIKVLIEDGTILGTKKVGNTSQIYSFVEKKINEWLDEPCVKNKKLTNREVAMLSWEQNNPEE